LGSRHHSLNMSEWMDVTDLLRAFELHNEVCITVSMTTLTTPKGPDLAVMVSAEGKSRKSGDQMLLASVLVKCSSLNLKALQSVVTHALYALDFQLALNEWGVAENKKA
jgi:hypothetical protein